MLRPAGYRVPLPAGRYRVTLHFAAVDWYNHRRVFDVFLEKKREVESVDFTATPFRTARRPEVREVRVEDGVLDLELVSRKGNPRLAALEIARISDSP